MKPEETLESKTIYEGRILNLKVDTVKLSNGAKAKREIVVHNPSVVIVALDEHGKAVMVRQYRKPTEDFILEVTAGTLEDGEDPDVCAYRELEEETGYIAGKMTKMGGFWVSPGFCTEYMHAYLATNLKHGNTNPDDDEEIEVVKVSLKDVPDMIRSGRIMDGKSIASLLMALNFYRDQLVNPSSK